MGAPSHGISALLLVRIAGLLNVSAGAARVAMSRMTADGEIVNTGGRYQLAGRLVSYQRRLMVHEWPATGDWEGSWTMLVVTARQRAHNDRQDLRHAMRSLRFAEYTTGTWIRPDNHVSGLPPADEEIVAEQCERFTVYPSQDDRALARRLWDLGAWNQYADRLLRAMRLLGPDLEDGMVEVLAPGLIVSAAAIRHASQDPLLPAELLPSTWLGAQFREQLTRHDERWQRLLRSWARAEAAQA
jgi:phenylacetic acid degradation operon negative regulatory protein